MMKVVEALENVIRPGTTRGLDFVTLEELRKRTGIKPREVLKFALSEMLCNALDTDASEIDINIQVAKRFCKEYRSWQQRLYQKSGGKFHSL